MSKIKVAELFYSIQGEGRFMGVPSVFLRTFGCNFTCGGFGMPKGQRSSEADVIGLLNDSFKSYDELPLVSTGCDSYASWHPKFKHLSPMMETADIVEEINAILPFHHWEDEHLVITGGEPLLGWQRSYPELLDQPGMLGLKDITIETNGTQELTEEFSFFLKDGYLDQRELTFSVSPKLSCSGEDQTVSLRPDIVRSYQEFGYTYLKFVVATEEDIIEALSAAELYRNNGFTGPIYLMPIGGVESVYALNNRRVAEAAMEYGLRYSDRLQVPLFKNQWGT